MIWPDPSGGKKFRICHVVFAFDRIGGLENGLINIINRSDPRRFHHTICALTRCGEICNRVTSSSVTYVSLHKKEGNDPCIPFALARVFRKNRIDLVHLRNWPTMVEGVIGARMAGVRGVIYSEHGRHFEDAVSGQRLKFIIKRHIFNSVPVLLTVSKKVRQEMIALYRIKREIQVIRNGVDTSKFRMLSNGVLKPLFPESDAAPVAGTVCRLIKGKGVMRFIRAFSNDPGWARLVIIGDGPERPRLEAFIQARGLERRIQLLGSRDDIPALLNRMDVFFLPSESEGLSNVVMEAMACGLPVVAFDTGGNRELVTHEKGGYLVPLDGMGCFLARVKELAQNRDRSYIMGEYNKNKVSVEFTLHHMVSEYTRMYEDLMTFPGRS